MTAKVEKFTFKLSLRRHVVPVERAIIPVRRGSWKFMNKSFSLWAPNCSSSASPRTKNTEKLLETREL